MPTTFSLHILLLTLVNEWALTSLEATSFYARAPLLTSSGLGLHCLGDGGGGGNNRVGGGGGGGCIRLETDGGGGRILHGGVPPSRRPVTGSSVDCIDVVEELAACDPDEEEGARHDVACLRGGNSSTCSIK